MRGPVLRRAAAGAGAGGCCVVRGRGRRRGLRQRRQGHRGRLARGAAFAVVALRARGECVEGRTCHPGRFGVPEFRRPRCRHARARRLPGPCRAAGRAGGGHGRLLTLSYSVIGLVTDDILGIKNANPRNEGI